jgi:hypothetical protein
MARDTKTILDSIIAEKETRSSLSGLTPLNTTAQEFLDRLNTTSKVGRWLNFFYCIAFGIKAHEDLFDIHKTDVEAKADLLVVGTDRWVRERCLEYQDGDSLQWNSANGSYGYTVPVEATDSKRVVQRASVKSKAGIVVIKVANATGGAVIPLTGSEKTGFTTYIRNIVPAGTQLSIISDNADDLHIEMTIKYDPLVLNSAGELKTDTSVKPVEVAINDHIASNIEFDGRLILTKLIDAVQVADGVVDCFITLAEAKSAGAATYTDIVPTNDYETNAGYLEIDSGFPLSSSITYTVA